MTDASSLAKDLKKAREETARASAEVKRLDDEMKALLKKEGDLGQLRIRVFGHS
ncbi:MAG: hypothetical protein ACREBU_10735 [Nitrososphaera sp.]